MIACAVAFALPRSEPWWFRMPMKRVTSWVACCCVRQVGGAADTAAARPMAESARENFIVTKKVLA